MSTTHQFPDIGPDPLKTFGDAYMTVNTVEAAKRRLMDINNLAQPGVPDQTALVWRADLSKLINDHTWRSCHLEPLRRCHTEVTKLREALSNYRTADFLTTEQQAVAGAALK